MAGRVFGSGAELIGLIPTRKPFSRYSCKSAPVELRKTVRTDTILIYYSSD
jgi:hypothetical protein